MSDDVEPATDDEIDQILSQCDDEPGWPTLRNGQIRGLVARLRSEEAEAGEYQDRWLKERGEVEMLVGAARRLEMENERLKRIVRSVHGTSCNCGVCAEVAREAS